MSATDPFSPPPSTKWNVLNLGAGVQSSCLALMAAKGEIGPMPDFAVFADTQAEPAPVYKWLDWLEKQLPFPVYRVTAGNLTNESLKVHFRKNGDGKYLRRLIPLFGSMPDGSVVGAIGRKCTADFKVRPILKFIRQKCLIQRGQKVPTVTQWIGISYDEMQRMKTPRDPWTAHRWPLVEKRMRRTDCIKWMRDNSFPEPPRSACYYCPFHSDDEWRRLRDEDPEFFRLAVNFDSEIRQIHKVDSKLRMTVYLHRSCRPLGEVDFDSPEDKGQLGFDFQAECEGMCGI